jgi:DNA-binding response OmpR family regulator
MLTARGEESERVRGLATGADDYVVKPFSPRELASRARAILRRVAPDPKRALDFGELCIDVKAREVQVRGVPVALTAREYDLLVFLAKSPRQVYSHGELLAEVWQSSSEWQDPATVTEYVRRIRAKIELDRNQPRWIRTVRAAGYAFNP